MAPEISRTGDQLNLNVLPEIPTSPALGIEASRLQASGFSFADATSTAVSDVKPLFGGAGNEILTFATSENLPSFAIDTIHNKRDIACISVAAASVSDAKDAIVIRQDGRVDASVQYLAGCGSKVNIVVEGDKVSSEQQKSLDAVVSLIAGKLGKETVELDDAGKLVSDALRGKYPEAKPETDYLSRETKSQLRAIEDAQRQVISCDDQSGQGRSPQGDSSVRRGGIREMSQEEASARGVEILKRIFSRLACPDVQSPYETVRFMGEGRGFGVGRYVMNFQIIEDWLDELFEGLESIKDPKARAKALHKRLANMVKHGKLGKDLAEKIGKNPDGFREQMHEFAQMLKSGKDGAKVGALMKELLPAELQERIAERAIEKFSASCLDKKGNIDTGKLAMAMCLGHVPNEQEMANKSLQALAKAAQTLEAVEAAREARERPMAQYNEHGGMAAKLSSFLHRGADFCSRFTPFHGTRAEQLAQAAERTASQLNKRGRCAEGAQLSLAKIGYSQFLGSGNAADMGRKLLASGLFEVATGSVGRGDLLVRDWSPAVRAQHGGKNYGDIAIIGGVDSRGRLIAHNDHHLTVAPDGGRYVNSYVLRLKDAKRQVGST
jgi:hypothetical protein